MNRKSIPEPTAPSVFPPNLDRDYFEDASKHPFRPQARAFEPVNAWWLAEAALLAYADEAFARRQFERAGLGEVALISKDGSQCYLAESRDFVIAAFRGTQVPKSGGDKNRILLFQEIVRDFEADADFRLVESGQGGFVHCGFKKALDSIWSALRPRLQEYARNRRPVWITGHSLGAALATLAADRLGGVQGLYVFGSPAVGDRAFADDFHVNTYRIVHRHDIVARVPPFGWYDRPDGSRADYVHVGALKYIDDGGHLRDEARATESLRGLGQEVIHSLFKQSSRVRLSALLEVARQPFDDHAPLYYALHCWNLYVDSRT